MKKLLMFLLLSLGASSILLAQPPPPPGGVPFDTGIGFFLGAVLLWAGTRKYLRKSK